MANQDTVNRRVEVLSKQMAQQQLQSEGSNIIAQSATKSSSYQKVLAQSDDDVVIIGAYRTAIARARKGATKDTQPDQLLAPLLKGILDKTGVDPKLIEDVSIGKVLGISLLGANQVRIASLVSGIPETAACQTINRQCSSGLQAIASVANSVSAGEVDIAIAGGVESMTMGSPALLTMWKGKKIPEADKVQAAKDCYLPMIYTSEKVAKKYNISRQEQDEAAVRSHQRALNAQKTGRFNDEIIPVTLTVKDKEGNTKQVIFDKDEGIRANTTLEGLSKLKPVFKKPELSTTAGNASQVSDGAAGMIMMKRSRARALGLTDKIQGRFVSFATVGVAPSEMGIGPAVAIPKVLSKAGLKTDDVDIYEINEAFGSQFVYSCKKLGLSFDKVNPNGGAIALGHPLGCTGARMTVTLLSELKKQNKKVGIVSMCVGSGMGAAGLFVSEN